MTAHLALASAINNIPDSWEVARFRFVARLRTERNTQGTAPLLSLSAAHGIQERDEGGLGRQAPSDGSIPTYWLVHPGDIVVNPMWLIEGGIAASNMFGAVSPAYRVYTPSSNADTRYLHHLLRSQPYLEQYNQYIRGVTTFDRSVTKDDFHDLPVILPSLEEQRRIADFLDAETSRIDRMLKARTAQKALLDERYLAEISELTVPGITDSKQRNHMWPWLPAEITLAQLGHYARIQTGITVHGSRSATSSDIEVPYLRVANVQGGRLDLTEIKSIKVPAEMARRATLQPLDVVMTEANGNPDNLGRGALWRGEIPNMTHQNHIFAIRVNRRKLLPEYLVALLASLHGRRYFRFTSTQVGIATTSNTKVLKFPVPAIRIERQKEIVGNYEQAQLKHRKLIAAIKRQSELLEERRRALITAAVTGEFDVSTASGRGIED